MNRNNDRLFMVCTGCGCTESMDPGEWGRFGDAAAFMRAHDDCGRLGVAARVLRFGLINDFYSCKNTAARAAFLTINGRTPGGAR